jgi:glutathione S-transferase
MMRAMSDLVLHHYDMSPYARKIRLILGLKGLPWRSVQIPVVMPKPDLTELTGGYRRTPVLQIGADVYCDTKLIARVIDRLHPEPPLVPQGQEATVHGLSRQGELSFMMVVTAFFGLGGIFDEGFVEDRRKMIPPGVDLDRAHVVLPTKLLQLRANLDLFERQLADGRAFLLGEAPCLADVSAYHPNHFLASHPVTARLLEDRPRLRAWMERVAALGEGSRSELDPGEAVAIAREAKPAGPPAGPVELPEGLSVGDAVVVVSEEYGSGNVAGELVASDLHEIAVRRRSERAGELVVHFPREEYLVIRAR